MLGLDGGADTGISVAQVEQMKVALEQNKKTAEFKIYPDAPMASTPTTAAAIARRRRRMRGPRCKPGSGNMAC